MGEELVWECAERNYGFAGLKLCPEDRLKRVAGLQVALLPEHDLFSILA